MSKNPSKSATEPRKQPCQARSRHAVAAIVEACRQILRTDGYSAASTRRIAERAGVSIGSLYQYFPSKEAVVVAVAEQAWREMSEISKHAVLCTHGLSPDETIRQVTSELAAFVRADRKLFSVLLTDTPSTVQRAPAVQQAIDDFLAGSDMLAEASFGQAMLERTMVDRWVQSHMILGGITAIALADEDRFDMAEVGDKFSRMCARLSTKRGERAARLM